MNNQYRRSFPTQRSSSLIDSEESQIDRSETNKGRRPSMRTAGRALFNLNCAGRNRTYYLQVMSLASYRCSTARPVHLEL